MKKGALIVAPVREAFKSITVDSGAIMAYNCVVEGQKVVPFVGLLDLYPDAAAAYSLRKLRAGYTGDAIRVRIDTAGQPTYDIGFDSNGELDTADLLSKATGNDAYVDTWYDQSGLGNDAIQATATNQPQIVSSGSVVLDNGKPSVIFNGTDNYFLSNLSLGSTSTYIHVYRYLGTLNGVVIDGINSVNRQVPAFPRTFNNTFSIFSGSTSIDDGSIDSLQHLHITSFDSLDNYYRDGVQELTDVNSGSNTSIGTTIGAAFNFSSAFNGNMQELIAYNDNQSSNRTGIETNINSHYNIY